MKSIKIARTRGFSLVELMVAVTLGVMIVTVAVQFILSSNVTYNATETSSRIQENARFALGILARDLRMAGYAHTGDLPGFFFRGACGDDTVCTYSGTGAAFDGSGSASDQVAVWQTPPTGRDCTGAAISVGSQLANVYTVVTNQTTGVGTLFCRGYDVTSSAWVNNGGPQPLLDGIDNMQVLYGISTNGSISRYVAASTVTSTGNWNNIMAIRLMILASIGENVGTSDDVVRSYDLLDADTLTISDKHTRRIFSTTVMINNAST
jgi:type IV pilus assembly protein PilW